MNSNGSCTEPVDRALPAIVFQSWRALVAAMAAVFAISAGAQTFPSRPITVIWPSVAGSSTDNVLRALATEVGKRLGQPVLIENRAGANGTLGLTAMTKTKPDGYFLNIAPHAVLIHLPLIDPTFKLEVEKDYLPIIFLLEFPLVIAANPKVPFRDVKVTQSSIRESSTLQFSKAR